MEAEARLLVYGLVDYVAYSTWMDPIFRRKNLLFDAIDHMAPNYSVAPARIDHGCAAMWTTVHFSIPLPVKADLGSKDTRRPIVSA